MQIYKTIIKNYYKNYYFYKNYYKRIIGKNYYKKKFFRHITKKSFLSKHIIMVNLITYKLRLIAGKSGIKNH